MQVSKKVVEIRKPVQRESLWIIVRVWDGAVLKNTVHQKFNLTYTYALHDAKLFPTVEDALSAVTDNDQMIAELPCITA